MMRFRVFMAGVSMSWIAAAGTAQDAFRDTALPLLKTHCGTCHSGPAPGGDLRVDSIDNLLRGGRRGPAMVPGKSAESLLVQFVRGEKTPRMPFGGTLPESVVAELAAAIDRLPAAPAKARN